MADTDDNERTESPTQKRLDDARKRGQVPRSRDLTAAAVVLAGGVGLRTLGALTGEKLLSMMRAGLSFTPAQALDGGYMLPQLESSIWQGLLAVAPVLGVLLAAAVLAPLSIGGWTFSTEALVPDWTRLNPVTGLGRVFSGRGALELLKALARFAVVGVVAAGVLWTQFDRFFGLATEPVGAGIDHAFSLCGTALIALACGLVAIALVDAPLAVWQHWRALRMTRQEIRDENKESDGNPESRGRVRRMQQEVSRKRMMHEVARADVVITNPTHYAVALRYDEKRMRAPILVAKGADLIAQRIREIAQEHRIAVVEAPPLARALHANCSLGDEIPARLYAAVAQVLTYVYQLHSARKAGMRAPEPPRVELP
ncbi:MAG: flagellar biosynthesis protein FlhB [Steroidobacterales bacterium]